MEIKQKRSNRTSFAFGEDELKYSIQDSSGSRGFSTPYTDTRDEHQKHDGSRLAYTARKLRGAR